jgi:hypothetical protein
VWEVTEQICIAAFEVQATELANDLLSRIQKQFGNTNRVLKLMALQKEALGDYYEAEKIYKTIHDSDPANSVCRE